MTRRVGNNLIIEAEEPQQCDYCGAIKELRPYGKDNAAICFDCATKPENIAITQAQFGRRLDGLSEGATR